MIREWRRSKGLPEDPLAAFRESGYMERINRERAEKNQSAGGSYA
jgi:L-rhamnose isomerase/sugar isomerase